MNPATLSHSLDKDRDGLVSGGDLAYVLESVGVNASPEDVQDLLVNVVMSSGSSFDISVRKGIKGVSGASLVRFLAANRQVSQTSLARANLYQSMIAYRGLQWAAHLLCRNGVMDDQQILTLCQAFE